MRTGRLLSHVKRIEKIAYPPHMRQMQSCRSINDLADYCECSIDQIILIVRDHWYAILADHGSWIEFVDLASDGKFPVFEAINILLPILNGKTVEVDARESTSYKLIKLMERRGYVSILRSNPWDWNGETMYEMEVKINNHL